MKDYEELLKLYKKKQSEEEEEEDNHTDISHD